MTPFLDFFGRLHLLVLHLPIGILAGIACIEGIAFLTGRPASRTALRVLASFVALFALLSAATGLAHAEDESATSTLEWHRNLGIAVAGACVLYALATFVRRAPGATEPSARAITAERVLLVIALALVVPAGHLGATLTHGEDFLLAPFHAASAHDPPATSDAPRSDAKPSVAATWGEVGPILVARCASCHGATRQKGGLSLHEPAAVRAGGENGEVIVAGKPSESEILTRIRAPIEKKSHMPPKGKPQPTSAEIAAIESWIEAGATFGDEAERASTPASAPAGSTGGGGGGGSASIEPAAADPAALAALDARRVHVEPIAQGTNRLWIEVAADAKQFSDADAATLLAPLAEQIAELSLARTAVTDATAALCAKMPRLARLDLRATSIGDGGLAALAGHAALAELIVAQTKLGPAAADALAKLPALRRVHVWKSGLTADDLKRLSDARPDVAIVTGDEPLADGIEAETEVKLGKEATTANAAAPSAPAVDPLAPVNTVCPVSGNPIDPDYKVIFKGKVIGFCCPHCPGKFLENPAAFEGKLH